MRKIAFEEGEYYHVYSRGVEKRIIFNDASDRTRFQKLLYVCNGTKVVHLSNLYELAQTEELYKIDRGDQLVHVGAYCILGNHFHLLLKEFQPKGISRFMQKLMTAYSMYFNKRNDRTGSLFEGTFRAHHADHDEYVKYLYSYIHLNPAQHIESLWKKKGVKDIGRVWKYTTSYGFSSFPDYISKKRSASAILSQNEFPGYFKNRSMKKEIFEWLTFDPESGNIIS